jgi:hypothetical protein
VSIRKSTSYGEHYSHPYSAFKFVSSCVNSGVSSSEGPLLMESYSFYPIIYSEEKPSDLFMKGILRGVCGETPDLRERV